MSNFSDYLEQQLLGHTLLGSSFTAPAAIFVGLITTLTTVTTEPTFTEVASGVGYGRRPISFNAPTSGPDWTVIQTGQIAFSQATDAWGDVAHFGLFDNGTIGGGNLLYWGDLPGGSQNIVAGDLISIPNGEISVRLD